VESPLKALVLPAVALVQRGPMEMQHWFTFEKCIIYTPPCKFKLSE
jgi:hypothetical protein